MSKYGRKNAAQRIPPASKTGQGRIDPELQAEIGKQLRALYDEVVQEPTPDRFVELLKRLDRSSEEKH